jgi:hypothetical protein
VHDVERGGVAALELVRVVQAVQHAHDEEHGELDRHRSRAVAEPRHHLLQRLPVQELHDDGMPPVDEPNPLRAHDVRVLEPERDARLVDEHLDHERLVRVVRVQRLDHDRSIETRTNFFTSEEDLGDSAYAKARDDAVSIEVRQCRR